MNAPSVAAIALMILSAPVMGQVIRVTQVESERVDLDHIPVRIHATDDGITHVAGTHWRLPE